MKSQNQQRNVETADKHKTYQKINMSKTILFDLFEAFKTINEGRFIIVIPTIETTWSKINWLGLKAKLPWTKLQKAPFEISLLREFGIGGEKFPVL